jgi:hypothetical protein
MFFVKGIHRDCAKYTSNECQGITGSTTLVAERGVRIVTKVELAAVNEYVAIRSTLKTGAVSASDISVSFYHITRCHVPEDSNISSIT